MNGLRIKLLQTFLGDTGVPPDGGLVHILLHLKSRNTVYKRLFGLLWYKFRVGAEHVVNLTPTYVYPIFIREIIRERFPSKNPGKYDDQYASAHGRRFIHLTLDDFVQKWPLPPKKDCCICWP